MPKGAIKGATKAASVSTASELDELKALVKAQSEQISQLVAQRQTTSGGGTRTYAPTQTPREVADELLALPTLTKEEEKEALNWYRMRKSAQGLVDIAQLMVKRIPNSPVDKTHPYGQPVLAQSKNNPNVKFNAMKEGVDRGTYIKLRNLVEQLQGDAFSYEEPRPLTDDQIDKVVRPALDEAVKLGIFEIEA